MSKKKITLYNTLSREKEEFRPIDEDIVSFYSCGQTIYEDIHIGNAKTYVVWDVLWRVLKHFGYNVKHIQNFTDVGHLTDDADEGEDKIAKKAKALKIDPMELVDSKIREYHEVMDAINVHRPDIAPRATGHIIEMQDMVQTLIANNHAYEVEGSVYFDISTFSSYGDLAKLDLENQIAGARIEVNDAKKNPGDFALWIKAPPEHIMQYSSPWGKGYPGWHIECSAMAMKYLGETIDIHAGGEDHIPVHHTNEIAQSEGTTGKKFANWWMHSAFITINGEKMSKSLGNFITLREIIAEYGAYVTRFSLVQAQYRTQADFSIDGIKAAEKRYYRLIRVYHLAQQALARLDHDLELGSDDQSQRFLEFFDNALADDLNLPKANKQLNAVSSALDKYRKEADYDQVHYHLRTFETMMNVLGVPFDSISDDEIKHVDDMINLRIELKKEGKYEESDKIRDHLQDNGYVLLDLSKTETEWYKKDLSNLEFLDPSI